MYKCVSDTGHLTFAIFSFSLGLLILSLRPAGNISLSSVRAVSSLNPTFFTVKRNKTNGLMENFCLCKLADLL